MFCAALLLCSCARESEPDSNVKAVVKLSVSDILSSSATITVESRQKDVTGYLLLPPQKYDDVAPYLSMDAIEKLAIIKDKAQKQENLTPLRVQGLKPRNKYFVGVVGVDSGGEIITAPVFTTFETVTLNTALSTVYEGRTPEGKYAFKAKLSPDPSTVKYKYVFDGKYIASTAAELREVLLSSSPDVKTATEAVEVGIESETKKVMLAALPFDLDGNEGQLSSLLSAGDMTLVTVDIDGVQTLESTEEDDNVYEGIVNVPSTAEFTVTISGEQYGFLSWSGVGGVGSFTEKYNIAYPPVGLNAAQNGTRPLSYSVSKSIGRMAKISDGGNKFWISLGAPAKLFVRIDLGNADGMVADAFKIGAGFQNADDRAKIACDRLLQGNQLQSLVFKLHFATVYFLIIAYDLVCELLVMFDEGFGRTINLFADVDAHFHKTNVEFSQLIIKYFMHQKFPLYPNRPFK